jgi:hypothetical protein
LSELAAQLLLVDVFAEPERFRLNFVGDELSSGLSTQLSHQFIDEVPAEGFFQELAAQCSATRALRTPTYFEVNEPAIERGFRRLLLPAWGEGDIALLLGAADTAV